jgi:hypothetical protein
MFVGHYGPAFAGKAVVQIVPLWILFIAVQLVDVAWAIFVLLGIEKVRLVEGFLKLSPLDLYYMPYTHGLISSLIWAIGAGALYVLTMNNAGRVAAFAVVAATVFSHWILDFFVHTHDLPIWDNTMKVGLGLWDRPEIALPLEAGVLAFGFAVYLRTTKAKAMIGKWSPWVVLALLVGVHVFALYQPLPPTPYDFAISALISYVVIAALAFWLDVTREPA